jgi:arsenate reductase
MSLVVYQYPRCSTCKKALAWLDAQGVAYRAVDIVETPPTTSVLKRALALGVPLKSLFNTSGESYRDGGFKDKLPTMSEKEALAALNADGKLVKRPLVIGEELALVGFREDAWRSALLS